MPVYRIAEVADLLGVSDDTVRRWIDSGKVPRTPTTDGRAGIAGADLAELARVLADDTDTEHPAGRTGRVSARNRLRGIVASVERDAVMAKVEMFCGAFRVVSLMSREAADELGLEAGVVAVASVKATNVVIERP